MAPPAAGIAASALPDGGVADVPPPDGGGDEVDAPLAVMHARGARLLRQGDAAAAADAFAALFEAARRRRVTHRDLHAAYSGAAEAALRLDRHGEALEHANAALTLLRDAVSGCGGGGPMGCLSGGGGGRFARATACRSLFSRSLAFAHALKPALSRDVDQLRASYGRALRRRGRALLGLARPAEALSTALDEALRLDPFDAEAKSLQATALAAAAAAGLSAPPPSAPLAPPPSPDAAATELVQRPQEVQTLALAHARSLPGELPPAALLTPSAAERDDGLREALNYAVVQADVRLPKRHIRRLEDGRRTGPLVAAVEAAVRRVAASGRDARVLMLGAGAGLLALGALRAGARHVTCVEPRLYLAQSCGEVLRHNGAADERFCIVAARPAALALGRDVPGPVNLIVCDGLLDDGLLSSGLVDGVRHALAKLATADAACVPAAATIFALPVEWAVPVASGGLDFSALQRHRRDYPSQALPCPLAPGALRPLAPAARVWRFDLLALPEEGAARELHFTGATAGGRVDAVAFWFHLDLGDGGPPVSSGGALEAAAAAAALFDGSSGVPAAAKAVAAAAPPTCDTLQPALQPLRGGPYVRVGWPLTLLAAHNTARVSFSVPDAGGGLEVPAAVTPDASFPQRTFEALADAPRLDAYAAALRAAIAACRSTAATAAAPPGDGADAAAEDASGGGGGGGGSEGGVTVLDVGSGCGVLTLLAAAAGADAAVGVEAHGALVEAARHAAAASGLGARASFLHGDASTLRPGVGLPPRGADVVVLDLFEPSLLGGAAATVSPAALVRHLRRTGALAPGALAVPASATVMVAGIELLTRGVEGFDLMPINKHRWSPEWEAARLDATAHRRLTAPVAAARLDFSADAAAGEEEAGLKPSLSPLSLPVVAGGVLNAVAVWVELEMGSGCGGLSGAPACFGPPDGAGVRPPPCYWGQAIAYLDHAQPLEAPGAAADDGESGAAGGEAAPPAAAAAAAAVALLLERAPGGALSFHLPPSSGAAPVLRSPWLDAWGGGPAVENPHRQRLLYCELLEKELLQRLPRRRGLPPVDREMKARRSLSLSHTPARTLALDCRRRRCRRFYPTAADSAAPRALFLENNAKS